LLSAPQHSMSRDERALARAAAQARPKARPSE
jgi:hypothetical protein